MCIIDLFMMPPCLNSYYSESIILWYDFIFICMSVFILYPSNIKTCINDYFQFSYLFAERNSFVIYLIFSKYNHVRFLRGLVASLSSQGRF